MTARLEPAVTGRIRPLVARWVRSAPRPGVWLAFVWLGGVVAVGVLADALPFQDPTAIHLLAARQGPSAAHWLGTDALGRDVLARMAFGARVDLAVALGAVAISGVLGCALGLVAGYRSDWLSTVIMWVMDALLAFPALILAVALAAFLGPSLRNVVLVISIVALPAFVRIARASTLQVRGNEYITAAKAYGATGIRIMFVHIWPNIRRTLLTFTLLFCAVAIIVEGALSFLGAGVPQPQPSWGGMIAEGVASLTVTPLTSVLPAIALFLTVLCLNAVAERGDKDLATGQRML